MRIRTCFIAICILFAISSPLLADDCSNVQDLIGAARNNPSSLRALLKQAPRCGHVWEALGDYYYDKKVWNESQDSYKKALELLPGNKRIMSRLRDLRPKATAMIGDEKEMLAYRKGLGGMTESASGSTSGEKSPSSQAQGKEAPMVIASARESSHAESEEPAPPKGTKTTRRNRAVSKRVVRQKVQKLGLVITFDYKSAELTPNSKKLLSDFSGVLDKELAGRRFLVEGNTDNIGGREYNKKLSVARAQSVKNYLTSCGVVPARLYVTGFGADRPIYDNDTPEGRAKNRRVEFAEK